MEEEGDYPVLSKEDPETVPVLMPRLAAVSLAQALRFNEDYYDDDEGEEEEEEEEERESSSNDDEEKCFDALEEAKNAIQPNCTILRFPQNDQ